MAVFTEYPWLKGLMHIYVKLLSVNDHKIGKCKTSLCRLDNKHWMSSNSLNPGKLKYLSLMESLFSKPRNRSTKSKIIRMMVMIMKYTSISVGRNITNNLIIQAITEIKKYIQPIMTITMMPRVISRIRAIQSISTTLRRKLVMFVQEDDYDEEESEFSMFQGSIYISTSNITRCLQVYTLLCNQSTTDVWCNEAPVQIVRPKKGKFSIISNVLTITTKINSIV